jgi:MFS family permease
MSPQHGAADRGKWGLDLLNFFLADVQTGFGPFVAVYLTAKAWTQEEIGFALTLGTVAAMVSQLPAGALVDAVRRKRAVAAVGILSVAIAALLLAVWPVIPSVALAQVLHGFASCMLTPTIAAISLALVGHVGLGDRLGRNARFSAIGNGLAAGAMGLLGSYVSERSVFFVTAALCLPALATLPFIEGHQVDPPAGRPRTDWRGLAALLLDRRLLVFALCVVLFHLSNAAMLPLAAGVVTMREGTHASLIIAACIMVPQAAVALLSPWVGRSADRMGRRTMLLLGWVALPLRGVLMAFLPAPWLLVAVQGISGISAAAFGVMLPLVASDLTRGTERFSLCIAVFSLAAFAGAGPSTVLAGWIADRAGDSMAFLSLALAGLAGTALVWLAMPETRSISVPE